jgi:hypothetical protein
MTTTNTIDFQALLTRYEDATVTEILTGLDNCDTASEQLNAVRACADLAHGRDRVRFVHSLPMSADSLIGSYFRAPDDVDPNAEASWLAREPASIQEGMVIGQPFTSSTGATYLVAFFGEDGATGHQELVELERMLAQRWQFFDSEAWLMNLARNHTTTTKEAA